MNNGWVKLHRSMLDWEWYTDINVCRLFTHMLLKANHKDKNWRGILIKRGQTLTSLNTLESETGLSKSQIRTAIKKLISTREIAQQSHSQHTVFTIKNYDYYQDDDTQNSKQVTSESHTNDTRVTSNKNEKNEKNEKNGKTTLAESRIPVKDLVEIYNQECTALPKIVSFNEKQKRISQLKARWNEDKERQNLDWWRSFFSWCNTNESLNGEKFDWIADLEAITNQSKFTRLIEKGTL